MKPPRPRIEVEPDQDGSAPSPEPRRAVRDAPAVDPQPPFQDAALKGESVPRVVRPKPRIEAEGTRSGRLDAPEVSMAVAQAGRWGMAALALTGFCVLAVGFAALWTVNFVGAEFDRGPVTGWLTLAVAAVGFGLLFAGLVRELSGLMGLRSVDRLRRDLAGGDAARRARAALEWVDTLPEGAGLRPALAAANDPDAILVLLRAGPEATLRARADALGRRAALQVVAGMAATPAPSLVVLLVTWRGLRLIRQVASLYGLRPGLLGTLGLLRRTALAATATAVVEVAVNTAAHSMLSTPLLTHLAGEMAGGAVAARRMVVLARAAAVACSPVPRV